MMETQRGGENIYTNGAYPPRPCHFPPLHIRPALPRAHNVECTLANFVLHGLFWLTYTLVGTSHSEQRLPMHCNALRRINQFPKTTYHRFAAGVRQAKRYLDEVLIRACTKRNLWLL